MWHPLFLNTYRSASHSRGENGRMFHEDDDVDDDPVVIGNHGNRKKISSAKVNWKTNGGESRDLNTLVEVQLNKVSRPCSRQQQNTRRSWSVTLNFGSILWFYLLQINISLLTKRFRI